MTGPTDILFASYGGGHVTMLERVFRKMTAEGFNSAYLALTTAQKYLAERKQPYFGYANFPEANDPAVLQAAESLLGSQEVAGPVSWDESIAYHGLNFLDLVAVHGERLAHEIYAQKGRQAFLPVRTMVRLLERVKPKLVVASNSPRTEHALFLAARQLGIPAVCIVDMFSRHAVQWIREPGYAARICVLNEEIRRFFVQQGCAPATVVVTGNPAFDGLNTEEMAEKGRRWRSDHGISGAQTVLLWASNVEPERHPFTGAAGDPSLPLRIEQKLRQIVGERGDWRLIVRNHPSEQRAFIPEEGIIHSPTAEALHPLLHAADVVVIMASTVGLEASIVGTPVVAVDLSIFTPDARYSALGMARGVNDLADLAGAIEGAIGQKQPRLANSCATESVCQQIRSLLSA